MSMLCPACGEAELREIAALDQVPVHCNVLHDNAEAAHATTRGDIVLGFCDRCSMIHNTAFDQSLLRYDQSYENSLHFSPRFQGYAEDLADQLLRQHGSDGLDIVELGCGKGDFLKLMTAGGANQCVGFDASFQDTVTSTADVAGLRIEREFFTPDTHKERADLLISRHVLEHIANPAEFLRTMGRALKDTPTATVFLEVPNGLWTLRDLGIWDLIFEHCSYFTENSLCALFEGSGLHPTRTHTGFEGQFLCIEATRHKNRTPDPEQNVEEIRTLAESFGSLLADKINDWEARLTEFRDGGRRAVIWGAGSKGVTFLNIVPGGADLPAAIDINPRKAGRYVPGTGQPVHSPDWLRNKDIDLVLVMNPVYEAEIQGHLAQLGSDATTITV